jgi:hypothetical protein
MLVSDLRHFLDLPDDVPGPARRLAEQLGSIVRAATASDSGTPWVSAIPCPRRPNRRKCAGTMAVLRTEVPATIEWRCSSCGDDGIISGWESSHFDLRHPRSKDPADTPLRSVLVTSEVGSTLRGLELIDLECERAVFGARADSGGVILTVTQDDLEELLGYVAAEANHEPDRRRQKRLDSAFSAIESALEVPKSTLERRAPVVQRPLSPKENPRVPEFAGKWHFIDSDLWDRDALELLGPAIIEIRHDRTGSFRFVAVEGWLDGRPATINGRQAVEFTWEGTDDGDHTSGRGFAVLLEDGALQVHIYFHMGDDSEFQAVPFKH